MSRPAHPADALTWWVRSRGGPACIGIDPVFERLPAEVRGADPVQSIESWCLQLLESVEPFAAAVKFQSACFERWGSQGVAALERCLAAARGRFLVILDWKRGDIGVSSEHYAAAAAGPDAAGQAILGAMIPVDGASALFVKFKGDAAVARREREAFARFVSSLRWR